MFYSKTFLARKGPLGTVWIAAHLQNKLRKHHVSDTDICSSVDCIMFSEVPIALRLSGHLLLGVVRIYSKKVEYLFQDCNDTFKLVTTTFAKKQTVDLPLNASSAPYDSITLPDKFNKVHFDALDENDYLYYEGDQNNHTSNREDITLQDLNPSGGDPSGVLLLTLYQDNRNDVFSEIIETEPMEEDEPVPSVQIDIGGDVSVSGLITHTDKNDKNNAEDQSTQVLPETEVMRDAVHDFRLENFRDPMDLDDNNIQQQKHLEEITNEKEPPTPMIEYAPVSGVQGAPSVSYSDVRPIALANSTEDYNSNNSLGHASHEMGVLSALPVEEAPLVEEVPPVVVKNETSRKRKLLFDSTVVLSNDFMKEALNDPSKLVHKRRKLPCSALDVWKFNNKKRKEQVFFEPSISGYRDCPNPNIKGTNLNTTLQYLFKKQTVCPQIPSSPETDREAERSNQDPVPDPVMETECIQQDTVPDPDIEIEQIRFNGNFDNTVFPPSPSIRDEFTPAVASKLVSEPETEVLPSQETAPMPTFEHTESTAGASMPTFEHTESTAGYDTETPRTHLEEQFDLENTGLSDIPELPNEELNFLEFDTTPKEGYKESVEAGASTTSREADGLTTRTRAVAQYLKEKSPDAGLSKEQVGNLSLGKILEGKTRKKCARMFYETLVLKNYDLIDVQQEEAYGDITLTLTSKLKKTQF